MKFSYLGVSALMDKSILPGYHSISIIRTIESRTELMVYIRRLSEKNKLYRRTMLE